MMADTFNEHNLASMLSPHQTKLSFIQLPTKKEYEEKPCECGVEHGPHWVLKVIEDEA